MRRAVVRVGPRPALAADAAPLLPTYELTQGGPVVLAFDRAALESGYRNYSEASWPFEGELGAHGELLVAEDGIACWRVAGALALVMGGHGWFHVRVAAPDAEQAASLVAQFARLYPPMYRESSGPGEHVVPVTFWTYTAFGPSSRMRLVEAPAWAAVAANYPGGVRSDLDRLMHDFTPGSGGQLMLWQGPPGTGKTWALRALAREWRDWAEFHYITDPDAFFVTNPDYMIDVLLADTYSELLGGPEGDSVVETTRDGKWRVLILEDTGELLAANAKDRQGQGLSRLLNVVDGLVGQGLKVLTLVTTNDELGDLHPAVQRPGRCAAALEFGLFSPSEAEVWLASVGAPVPVENPLSLAELYDRVEDPEPAPLTAGAVVATSETGRQIGNVAARHASGANGYGDTAWNSNTGTVFWASSDATTEEQATACRDAFMEVDGVSDVEICAECPLPTGDEWEVVYSAAASEGQAALDRLVDLANLPLDQDIP